MTVWMGEGFPQRDLRPSARNAVRSPGWTCARATSPHRTTAHPASPDAPHTLPQRVEPAPLDPGTRPETSENDERAWREAATVLQPPIDWTHRVKSLNPPELRRIANPDSVCGQ